MDKVEKPKGLIRYASMKGIKDKVKFKVTPRIILYSVLLVILLSIFTTLLLSREDVKVNVLRAPGKIFQEMPDGKISNLYHVKLVNNTFKDIPVEVKINNPDAEFKLIGMDISLPSLDVRDAEFMILFNKDKIKSTVMQLNIQIYANGKIVNDIKTTFIGPPKN
jgi:polyferredoxin